MFLHGGFLHLLGNVWFLWLFGDNIEDRLGHWRYLLFYVLAGVLAGLLHAALNFRSTVPTIGASGAIAGVLGAYFMCFPFSWITVLIPVLFLPLIIKLPAVIFLLLWITSQVAGGYDLLSRGGAQAGGIAFWAHVGGFAAGVWLIRSLRTGRSRSR
jgi:membrane associated rhomboid family serine protease